MKKLLLSDSFQYRAYVGTLALCVISGIVSTCNPPEHVQYAFGVPACLSLLFLVGYSVWLGCMQSNEPNTK